MRVKVGNVWHSVTPDQSIMVELTEADKTNIANMHPETIKYALFDNDNQSAEEKKVWME